MTMFICFPFNRSLTQHISESVLVYTHMKPMGIYEKSSFKLCQAIFFSFLIFSNPPKTVVDATFHPTFPAV